MQSRFEKKKSACEDLKLITQHTPHRPAPSCVPPQRVAGALLESPERIQSPDLLCATGKEMASFTHGLLNTQAGLKENIHSL